MSEKERNLRIAESIYAFAKQGGGKRLLTLLVDWGFTGKSSFVLDDDAIELIRAEMPPAQATGALQGAQDRGWVSCRIPELSFQRTLIAILTDLSPLSLPAGVQGMAGLRFLRQFARWGAERTGDCWQFFLPDSKG